MKVKITTLLVGVYTLSQGVVFALSVLGFLRLSHSMLFWALSSLIFFYLHYKVKGKIW